MDAPIGLFDSGFGGLTVMREFIRLLPKENLIYFGDTAHLPYGNKSPETVIRFAQENSQFLMKQGIKLLVIACHTACCHALDILQKELPIPVIGVIDAGLNLIRPFSRIGLLGTTSTIESGLYQRLILQQNPGAAIFAKACPLFVPLVEEGFYEHKSAHLIAKEYLKELKGNIDAALLACTHYPLIKSILEKEFGPHVTLVEPALECARRAFEILKAKNQLNSQTEKPLYQFYASDDPLKFQKLGKIFLGQLIKKVEKNKKS